MTSPAGPEKSITERNTRVRVQTATHGVADEIRHRATRVSRPP